MVGYKAPYYSNMKNSEYWSHRAKENLAECFGTTETVNDYLTKLYKKNLKTFVKEYNDLMTPYIVDGEPDLAKLNKALTYDKAFKAKVRRFEVEIAQFSEMINEESQTRILNSLIKTYKMNYYNIAEKFGVSLNKLDARAVEVAVRVPWTKEGREFSGLIWENVSSMNNELRETLSDSIAKGESIQKTTEKFKKIFGSTTYNTQRLIRTETLAVYAKSSVQSYKDIGIKQLEILAENEACDDCEAWDGEIINLDDAVVGVNIPPCHPNCRCCVKPVIDWRD